MGGHILPVSGQVGSLLLSWSSVLCLPLSRARLLSGQRPYMGWTHINLVHTLTHTPSLCAAIHAPSGYWEQYEAQCSALVQTYGEGLACVPDLL